MAIRNQNVHAKNDTLFNSWHMKFNVNTWVHMYVCFLFFIWTWNLFLRGSKTHAAPVSAVYVYISICLIFSLQRLQYWMPMRTHVLLFKLTLVWDPLLHPDSLIFVAILRPSLFRCNTTCAVWVEPFIRPTRIIVFYLAVHVDPKFNP